MGINSFRNQLIRKSNVYSKQELSLTLAHRPTICFQPEIQVPAEPVNK